MTVNNLVLPSDNAIIDYSIFSQLINAINDLQLQINKNAANANPGSAGSGTGTGTGTGNTGTGSTAPASIKMGTLTTWKGTSATVKVPEFSKIATFVATVEATQTKAYAVVTKIVGNQAYLNIVGASASSSGNIHWVALGS